MSYFLDSIEDLADRAVAEKWLNDLEASGEDGTIVAHNWRTDPNVAEEKVPIVARKLAERVGSGTAPCQAVKAAVGDDCLCADETKCACGAAMLSRIVTYDKFETKILNRSGAFTGAVTEDSLETFLGDLDPERLDGFVEGRRPIAWCTPTDELEAVAEADTVRSVLGLAWDLAEADVPVEERFRKETLVELMYSPRSTPGVHLPTVFEAGWNPRFLPSEAGSEKGHTMDLRTGKPGVTEYVHGRFLAEKVKAVGYRGRLVTDAPGAWKAKRLQEIRGR